MRFIFISEPTFIPWDWRTPDTTGIPGSETAHIRMAQRLARRGHEVISYSPTPFVHPQIDDAGVEWRNFATCDFSDEGLWIIYRAPHLVDFIPRSRVVWHVCQDVSYQSFYDERISRFSRILALSNGHGDFLQEQFPHAASNIFVSANGIDRRMIDEVAADPPTRNPKRLMFASSPDRWLPILIPIFVRAREVVPELELHCYYGFDYLQIIERRHPDRPWIAENNRYIESLIEAAGVVNHGRLSQHKLIREWFKAGIWCHPSDFTETSCITSMEAQACGAIPITRPYWAVGENVKHGVFLHGETSDSLVKARYVWEIVKMAMQPELQEEIRAAMMSWAREHFDWEHVADQWEAWAREDVRGAETSVRRDNEIEAIESEAVA